MLRLGNPTIENLAGSAIPELNGVQFRTDFPRFTMINDLTDLQLVLGQYETEKLLIGPLLNLSINSSFRFFYIAGKGQKTYQSIGLGFIEVETDARQQRAHIVAQLQSRFGEVTVLDNQFELACEANKLWPNEETARFLGTAALEAKLQPAMAGRDESLEGCSEIRVAAGDHCNEAYEDPANESVTLADAVDPILSSGLSLTPEQDPSAPPPNATLKERLPDAYATWPLNSNSPPAKNSRHAAPEQDDLALAVLSLTSSSPIVADAADTGTATAAFVATAEPSTNRRVGRSTSTIYRLCAFAGAAAIIAGMVVVTSTRQIEKRAAPTGGTAQVITADQADDRSQRTGSVIVLNPQNLPQSPSQAAEAATAQGRPATELGPQAAASLATSAQDVLKPLPPQIQAPHVSQSPPSQIASAQVDAPPMSGVQSSSSQVVKAPAATAADERLSPTINPHRASASETPTSEIPGQPAALLAQTDAPPEPKSRPSPDSLIATAPVPAKTPASQPADGPVVAASQNASPALEPKSPPVADTVITTAVAPANAPASRGLDAPRADGSASVSSPQSLSYPSPDSQAKPFAERSINTQSLPDARSAAALAAQPQTAPSQLPSAKVAKAPISAQEPQQTKLESIPTPLGADALEGLLSRSNDFIKNGDFAAARILLRRAAEAGSADAALMLGKTFDPLFLRELGAMGMEPDLAQCRQWYENAAKLGSEAAAQRLANLGPKSQP